jgi:ADP-heptose:LPS heptosyltransferase
MRIVFKSALGDEVALTAVIREFKRQHPDEIVRVEMNRMELLEGSPHLWTGITESGQVLIETHRKEQFGSIPHSFALQLGMTYIDDHTPEIFLTETERNWALRELDPLYHEVQEGHKGRNKPVIAVDTRATWPSRRWPWERYQELVHAMKGEATFIEVGHRGWMQGKKEMRLLDGVARQYVDKTEPRESAALMWASGLFLGNDSGCFHLAAAVGCPQVVFFASKKWWQRGYWNTVPVFALDDCKPSCEIFCTRQKEGPKMDLDNWCLGKIGLRQVAEAIHVCRDRFRR